MTDENTIKFTTLERAQTIPAQRVNMFRTLKLSSGSIAEVIACKRPLSPANTTQLQF